MSLWPTPENQNLRRHPRAGRGPCSEEVDSRFRGNDVDLGTRNSL
jgi:hypothetical protein